MPRIANIRRLLLGVTVGAVTIVGTVAAAGVDGATDVPTERAVRLDPPDPAVVIGDSSIAALRWVPGAANAVIGFDHLLDLESCRRLFFESCYGREQRKPPTVYEALELHGGRFNTLVVATGYNDGTSQFASSFEAVVERARSSGYRRIVWYTLRSGVDYVSPGQLGNHETFARNNEVVRDLVATGDYPEVVIADWGTYSAAEVDWYVTDGVHFRQLGAWAAADYLTRKMAFLDGSACPIPTSPGRPVEDPCLDPDVTGPVADIDALYNIGEDGVLCYEIGVERRFECRSDSHVIELTRELRVGDVGDDVESLQTRLIRLELVAEGADGSFGPATESGVRDFQDGEGLPVTGVADIDTLAALGFDVGAVAVGP